MKGSLQKSIITSETFKYKNLGPGKESSTKMTCLYLQSKHYFFADCI